jgi:hypothetical protein
MIEVYLLGCCVAYSRLQAIGTISVGIGGWCLMGAALAAFLATINLDEHCVWNALSSGAPRAGSDQDLSARPLSCNTCGLGSGCTVRASRLPALRGRALPAQTVQRAAHDCIGHRRLCALYTGQRVAHTQYRTLRPRPAQYHTQRRARTCHIRALAIGCTGVHRKYYRAVGETLGTGADAGAHTPALTTLAHGPHAPVSLHRFHWPVVEHRSIHDFRFGGIGQIRRVDHGAARTRSDRLWCGHHDHDVRISRLRSAHHVGRAGGAT